MLMLAQHSLPTLLRDCFEWLQHCPNIAALCCVKNQRCESSRVTLPLRKNALISRYQVGERSIRKVLRKCPGVRMPWPGLKTGTGSH